MGVPFFVIGSRHTLGFNEEEKDLIGQWIIDEYNNKNRFDLLYEMSKTKVSTPTDENDIEDNKLNYIVIGILIIVIIILFVITMNKNNPKQIKIEKNNTNKKSKEKTKKVKDKIKEKTKKKTKKEA